LAYSEKCISLANKIKLYSKACACAHNVSIVYQTENKIDSAILLEERAIAFAIKAKDMRQFYISKVANAQRQSYLGKFTESNKICFECLPNVTDMETRGVIFNMLAANFDKLNLSQKAKYYYQEAINSFRKSKSYNLLYLVYANLTDYYNANNNYKDALKLSDSILLYSKSLDAQSYYYLHRSISYKGLKDWRNAIASINHCIEIDSVMDNEYNVALDYKERGNVYNEMKLHSKALGDFALAMKKFEGKTDDIEEKQLLRDYVRTFLLVYHPDVAKQFEKYIVLNEAINNETVDKNGSELDTKYRTAEKEAQIKTQQLQLANEKSRRNMALSGIGFIILLSGGGFMWFKNQQKQKSLQTQNTMLSLQQNINYMELQNLNQQLDPHELKNLLASISPEIQTKAPDAYRQMLKLFNLTKASLNSKSITDSLENQVQQIDDFLSLEKNMLSVPLTYSIHNSVENTEIQMPRLILKNLVENSVTHGIKGKPGGGNISVSITDKNGMIHIEVDDSGVGRKNAISSDSGIGTSTYQKLFVTLNHSNKEHATFGIFDKEEGTRVEVRIPVDYKYS
jgi:tetratricopeptide (TPR) repeat protein